MPIELDKLISSTSVNTVVTIISIAIGLPSIIISIIGFRKKIMFWLKKVALILLDGSFVTKNRYYSSRFVLDNIESSKEVIKILCVRNERISDADVVEALRKFIVNKGGRVELYGLDPSVADCVIEECMGILPAPPASPNVFKDQVKANYDKIFGMYLSLGASDRNRLKYFEYSSLPVIHMCQFDGIIYHGFQLYFREGIDDSLLQYSATIAVKSDLGKKLSAQLDYLREWKSRDVLASQDFTKWSAQYDASHHRKATTN